MNKILLTISLISVLLLSSCSNKDEPNGGKEEAHETTQSVQGKVEKGPFVRGSIVELRTLKADMSATGKSFTATIENNFGNFDFGTITVESQYAKLQAEGYFFNEVKGELSPSTINLNAIVDLTDSRTVNVNLLTHLKSERIVSLVKQGSTYKEANAQAQKELLTAFGLQKLALKDASQFSIASGDDAAAVLIAISSLVLYDRSVAETVEFLSRLTAEFSQYGTFRPETKETLRKTRNELNYKLSDIEYNVRQRYFELGIDVNVKNLAYFFDWDGNGVAGDEIFDGDLELETNEILVSKDGGLFEINLHTDKPIFFEIPDEVKTSFEDVPSQTEYFDNIYEGSIVSKEIEFTSSIEGDKLQISVEKAEFKSTKEAFLPLYNARGQLLTSIKIRQEGDPSITTDIPNLNNLGQQYVASIFSYLSTAYSICHQINLTYYVTREYQLPLDANNGAINNCYSYLYSSIRRICELKRMDAQKAAVYQNICNAHLVMVYLTIVKHWGDAAFYTSVEEIESNYNLPRTPKNVILDELIRMLKSGIDDFDETIIQLNDINQCFRLSKDVVNALIARCYLEKADYASAITYFEKLYSNGLTNWDSSVNYSAVYSDNSECVYAFYPQSRSSLYVGYEVIPVIDFKDICFEYAECCQYMGDSAKSAALISELCKQKYLDYDNPFKWSNSSIAELRQLIRAPYFAPYANRTEEGKTIIGIAGDKSYQALWPIPGRELVNNPAMTQNPGY